jgi:hypothetical protein
VGEQGTIVVSIIARGFRSSGLPKVETSACCLRKYQSAMTFHPQMIHFLLNIFSLRRLPKFLTRRSLPFTFATMQVIRQNNCMCTCCRKATRLLLAGETAT